MAHRAHHARASAVALVTVAAALAGGGVASGRAAASSLPPIKHVWVVVLENEGEAQAFAGNTGSYLYSLTKKGAFIANYFGIGHQSLPNYVAMISGQGPTPQNQGDCQAYSDITPTTPTDHNQPQGDGCVYSSQYLTVADQVSAAHLSWKGYMEDLHLDDLNHGDSSVTCQDPKTPPAKDPTQNASGTDQYAARHDPFMYFHSVIDSPSCASNVVALQSPQNGLLHDLTSVDTTPNFSFISPNLCNDGHDTPCKGADVAGDTTGGLTSIDHWLRAYIPQILASPAYVEGGLLMVTFDEAGTTSSSQDASSCCNEPFTASGAPAGGYGLGGGQVGSIVLSPYITPGTKPRNSYNHYSLLRTVEDLFHFTGGDDGAGHLGLAATWSKVSTGGNGSSYTITSFGDDVFTNPDYKPPPVTLALSSGIAPPPPRVRPASSAAQGDNQSPAPPGPTSTSPPAATSAPSPAASPSPAGRGPLTSKWSPHFLSTAAAGNGLGLYVLVLLPLLALGVAAGLVSRRRSGGT